MPALRARIFAPKAGERGDGGANLPQVPKQQREESQYRLSFLYPLKFPKLGTGKSGQWVFRQSR